MSEPVTNSTVSAERPASRDGLHSAAVSAASAREALLGLWNTLEGHTTGSLAFLRELETFISQHSTEPSLAALSQAEKRACFVGQEDGEDRHALAQRVWEALDRKSCPGVYMQIAYETITSVPPPVEGENNG